jgi:hypothetical protein
MKILRQLNLDRTDTFKTPTTERQKLNLPQARSLCSLETQRSQSRTKPRKPGYDGSFSAISAPLREAGRVLFRFKDFV